MKYLVGIGVLCGAFLLAENAQEKQHLSLAEAEILVLHVPEAIQLRQEGIKVHAERSPAPERKHPTFLYYQLRSEREPTPASNLVGNYAVSRRSGTVYDQVGLTVVKPEPLLFLQEIIRRNRNIKNRVVDEDEALGTAPY